MADLKVRDRVRVRPDVKRLHCGVISAEGENYALVRFDCGHRLWCRLSEIERIESVPDTPQPDPRDAEIAALRSRVAELESRQADVVFAAVKRREHSNKEQSC